MPDADHSVGSELLRMMTIFRVCIGARAFAQRGVYRDVAAEQRLQTSDKISDNRARTYRETRTTPAIS